MIEFVGPKHQAEPRTIDNPLPYPGGRGKRKEEVDHTVRLPNASKHGGLKMIRRKIPQISNPPDNRGSTKDQRRNRYNPEEWKTSTQYKNSKIDGLKGEA